MKSNPTILHIVHENTSTLDTTLPFLLHYKSFTPKAKIVILYTRLNKNQVTRNGSFYTSFLPSKGIIQLDLSDFSVPFTKRILSFVKKLFSIPTYDYFPKFKIFSIRINQIKYLFPSLRIKLEKFITEKFITWDNILPEIDPTIVLWDLRGKLNFNDRNQFSKFFSASNIPLVLIPHAPHNLTETRDFFNNKELILKWFKGNNLPSYCYFWLAFLHSKPWKVVPEHRSKFLMFGYPGFDKNWINYIRNEFTQSPLNKNKHKRIIISLRYFSAKGIHATDPKMIFNYTYEETINMLNAVGHALREKYGKVEIILKPHPKTNSLFVQSLLKELTLHEWNYSYDSFYNLLPTMDLYISSYTTAVFLPMAFSIPVILINSKVQDLCVENWAVLKSLYASIEVKTDINNISDAIEYISNNTQLTINNNMKAVKKYWILNSLNKCGSNLESILGYKG